MKGDFLMQSKQKKQKKETSRERDFAFLLYPESMNPKWKQILADLKIPVFWIFHDRDTVIDEETGETVPKKPHYHVMLMFANGRSANTARKISIRCGGNGHLEDLLSRNGYARYLIHIDDPEKYQYSSNDVVCLGGADYEKATKTRAELKSSKIQIITDIFQFIDDNQIHIYSDLLRYCAQNNPNWLDLLLTYSGHVVKDYIRSEAYDFKDKHPQCHFNRFYFD